jgi:predicted DNA binding protein
VTLVACIVKYLDATFDLPPELRHPMGEFLRDSDAIARIEIRAWNITPGDVEYILAHVEGAIGPYRERIASVDSVRDATLAPIDEGSFYVYVRQETRRADRQWRQAFEQRDLVTVPPIVYDGDGTRFTIVGDTSDLQALLDDLPDGVGVTVEEVSDYDRRHATIASDVTDRQFEAVSVAAALGYYAVPREADLAAVAAELGCAESTASNLLRKAESSVMRRLVGAA